MPNAFTVRFPAINRVRERGRAFEVGGQPFAIVERTIGGIDDVVYNKHRDVWENLPRGNARVFVPSSPAAADAAAPAGGYTEVAAVNGLRKFGYSDSSYGYPSEVVKAVAIEKENGECGHLAAFTLPPLLGGDGEPRRYWVVGSKNVHVVLRYDLPEEDFAVYSGMRYSYALKIARLWRDMMTKAMVSPQHVLSFHEAMATNQWTSCFEAIFATSQHLVDYDGANELRFYAVTVNKVNSHDGLCMDVDAAEKFYKDVGLYFSHRSPCLALGSPEYAKLLDDIARRRNSEGCVMYGYNAQGTIIRLWKEKSYPYVMERASREAITTNKLAGRELVARLKKKLAMQPSELRKYFAEWELERLPWLVNFGAWLQMTKVLTPHMDRDAAFEVRNQWLTLQKNFQKALDGDNELIGVCKQYEPDAVAWGDPSELDVIKFVGAQGSGKSTLARALFVLLTKAGQHPRWVNQDEAGNRNNFLAAIRQATNKDAGVTHLIIDKMNLDERTNNDYKDLPMTVTVAFTHPDGENAMIEECFRRVVDRGSGHRTIRIPDHLTPVERKAELNKIRKFLSDAVRSCMTPDDDTVVELDVTVDLVTMLQQIWPKLQTNGLHVLPKLEVKDAEEAIALSQEYERLLCDQPKAPIYAAIAIKDPAALLKVVPNDMLQGKNVQSAFHVTTKYFVGDPDPVFFVRLAKLVGKEITLTLRSVVSDPKGTAIVVRNENDEFPCANPIAHITVANRAGIPPRYSNELVSALHASDPARKELQLPPNTTLKGVFDFR